MEQKLNVKEESGGKKVDQFWEINMWERERERENLVDEVMQIFKYVNIFNLICFFFFYNIEAGKEAVSLRLLKFTLLCFDSLIFSSSRMTDWPTMYLSDLNILVISRFTVII